MRSRHFHPPRRRCRRGTCTHRRKYGKQEIVMVRVEGQPGVRTMHARDRARQLGRARGGRQKARNGNTSGNFTSETARKAAKKLWATRWRKIERIGARVGYPANRRAPVGREAIREAHLWTGQVEGVYYNGCNSPQTWVECWVEVREGQQVGHTRCITERTALQKLGHLPRPRKHLMPVE